jgi:hypothetical protein
LARAASNAKTRGRDAATATEARPRERRRVPSLILGLAGAVIAVAYASIVEKMRFGPPLVMVGLGGLTLVLSAVALWRVVDPLARAEAPAAEAPRAPQRIKELEREKQLVLKAIKEIELDFQMRKLAEADYRAMIERYRARAMRLISEIEAGDNYRELIERELKDRLATMAAIEEHQMPQAAAALSAAVAAATAVAPAVVPVRRAACGGCGTTNDEDAQFCKKCGAKLG